MISPSGVLTDSIQRLKTPPCEQQQQQQQDSAATATTTTWSSFRTNRRKISPLTQLHERDEESG